MSPPGTWQNGPEIETGETGTGDIKTQVFFLRQLVLEYRRRAGIAGQTGTDV